MRWLHTSGRVRGLLGNRQSYREGGSSQVKED
jgi:hypothetical protein